MNSCSANAADQSVPALLNQPARALVHAHAAGATRLPKLCGADIELGNFISGDEAGGGTGARASRLLLRQVHGFPTGARQDYSVTYEDQDWGRKYLKENGGCIYIDLDHLELA